MSDRKGDESVSSTRPYLLRAIYDWAVDNGLTPQVLVDADHEGVQVPMSYVQDGTIVLNIHPRAVTGMEMDNDHLFFATRFGGQPFEIFVPMGAVLAIFARENGQGIFFDSDEGVGGPGGSPDGDSSGEGGGAGPKRSHLKLVK